MAKDLDQVGEQVKFYYLATLNPYTMNETQRLIEAVDRLLDCDPDIQWKHRHDVEQALAAAKEERGRVLTVQEIDALCDAYHNYVKNRYPDQWAEMSTGFEAGVRAVADSGYLAPAKGSGLTVEVAVAAFDAWIKEYVMKGEEPTEDERTDPEWIAAYAAFRKALEDLAGKE